jgi:hypothetical protein
MSEINVVQRTQRLIVDMPTRSVAVINTGPPGPAGPVSGITQGEFDALALQVVELEARIAALENP